MSGFSVEWLALREPLDRQARNPQVLDAVAAAFQNRSMLSIFDLGSGTGSTLRALSPRLPKPQQWTLLDNDPVLLAEAFAMSGAPDVKIETRQFDLTGDIGSQFDGATDLVTASALLDLVSEPWLAGFAAAAAARSLPAYIALTYDGRAVFDPPDPIDAQIVAAVNTHQRGNKGFGPALGPRAASFAVKIFQSFGYTVIQGESDWVAGSDRAAFQTELLTGWMQAAGEVGGLSRDVLEGWLARRNRAIAAGTSLLRVGHVDLFAQPSGR